MITRLMPKDWKDLQTETGKILSECGFTVEVEKKCDSARGNIEIDVYAEEIFIGRKNKVIIECKYWDANIPQTIIHAFRTVLNDIGANTGYIVAKSGFQSGSFNASQYSNIELLTWEQFQDKFEVLWYQKYFSEYVESHFDALCSYAEPLVPNWALKLQNEDVDRMKHLREEYEEIGWVLLYMMKYSQMNTENWIRKLPLSDYIKSSKIPTNILSETGYRELIPLLHAYCDPAIEAFHKLKEKVEKI